MDVAAQIATTLEQDAARVTHGRLEEAVVAMTLFLVTVALLAN